MIEKTLKDEAFTLILKGTLIQIGFLFGPLIRFALSNLQAFLSSSALFDSLSSHIVNRLGLATNFLEIIFLLLCIIVGYVFFVRGCLKYASCKGYPSALGWLGLLSWLGLIALLLIPDRGTDSSLKLSQKNQNISPFSRLNVIEITFLFLFALSTIFLPLIYIFSILGKQSFELAAENILLENAIAIAWFSSALFIFLKIAKKSKFDLAHIFGFKNKISVWHIIFLAILKFGFACFLNPITLYGISYIFPKYVEDHINDSSFTTIFELILWSIIAVIMAPLVEEFLCRGLIMQKWALKWGMKWGILASSFLFAVYHFRFDVLPLSLAGIFYSILYVRTGNLLAPMLCHAVYNAIVVVWTSASFFTMPVNEREAFVSVGDYRSSVEPHLGIYIFLGMLIALIVVFVLRRFFPRQSETIPYIRNQELAK